MFTLTRENFLVLETLQSLFMTLKIMSFAIVRLCEVFITKFTVTMSFIQRTFLGFILRVFARLKLLQ